MKTGIYTGLSFEQYLAIEAVNKSSLDDMRLSPLHYWARNLDPLREVKTGTRAMKLGTDIHCAVLEPDRFYEEYVVIPADAPRRPTEAQINAKKPSVDTVMQVAFWAQFDTMNAGKSIIKAEQHQLCLEIASRIRKHPVWIEMLHEGLAEVTLVWIDPETGLPCKARVDWLPVLPFLLDIKSVECAAPDEFGRKVADYDWHVQAAWYCDGYKVLTGEDRTFVFGAVEKANPPEPMFYYADAPDLAIGRRVYRPLLNQIAKCKKSGRWPGYPVELQRVTLPAWLTKGDIQTIEEGVEVQLETY